MVALDRADLPPEAIDAAVRALADEGVEYVLDVRTKDDIEPDIRHVEKGSDGSRRAPDQRPGGGSTCGKSAGCRC